MGELTGLLELSAVGRTITGGRIVGRGSTASADLHLDNGEVITFESLRDFANPKLLAVEVAACTGATPALKAADALRALSLLRTLSELHETWTEDDISRGWGIEHLQSVEHRKVNMRDQGDRWRVFTQIDAALTPLVLDDENDARLVRCGWFLAFVREQTYISPAALAQRMERVGWKRRGTRGGSRRRPRAASRCPSPGRSTWSRRGGRTKMVEHSQVIASSQVPSRDTRVRGVQRLSRARTMTRDDRRCPTLAACEYEQCLGKRCECPPCACPDCRARRIRSEA